MHETNQIMRDFQQALAAGLESFQLSNSVIDSRLAEALQSSFAGLCRSLKKETPQAKALICAAVMDSDMERFRQSMRAAAADADLLELRLDALKPAEPENLLPFPAKPVIVTNRKKEEGGSFRGTETERLALLQTAVNLGADYVDLEFRTPEGLLAGLMRGKKTARIILSCHDMRRTPGLRELRTLWEDMTRIPADYYKIVTFAQNPDDNWTLLCFLRELPPAQPRIICHAMGPFGLAGRILAPFFGSQIAYAAPRGGRPTAAGQLEAGQMKKIWEVLQPGLKI